MGPRQDRDTRYRRGEVGHERHPRTAAEAQAWRGDYPAPSLEVTPPSPTPWPAPRSPLQRKRPDGGREPGGGGGDDATGRGAQSFSLGLTSGVVAGGAWAARWEVAGLLEARCDPGRLVDLIRSGEEGDKHLVLPGGRSVRPASGSAVSDSASVISDEKDDIETTMAGQRALLESLAPAERAPEWARDDLGKGQSARRVPGPPVPAFALGDIGPAFTKPATPPPASELSQRRYEPVRRPLSHPPAVRGEEEVVEFSRPAVPPPRREASVERPPPARTRFSGTRTGSLAEREGVARGIYDEMVEKLYRELKTIGVSMEISPLVEVGKVFDIDRFSRLTAPNRASTGLGYARMLARLLRWRAKSGHAARPQANVDEVLGVLEFVETLIQEEVGYLTPKTLFYTLEFFGKALGFDPAGAHWNRAKRLADFYAKTKVTPTSRAPFFRKSTLRALECLVMGPFTDLPVRVAAGKLRLCAQASIRYDDLLNTPLRRCEWVRRPGSTEVVGLRSRAAQGKSGPRLWIASLKAVDPSNDKWLVTLMSLLLRAHGSEWRSDDHTGKAADGGGSRFLVAPSTLSGDASLVKRGLEAWVKEGQDVGMTPYEIATLRWHGAKSTFTTIMQHLGEKPLAVRFAGNWSSREDTMPDVYLREALTLVLEAQERCLSYLRAGGELVQLEGAPLDSWQPRDADRDPGFVASAMASVPLAAASVEELSVEFLDGAFKPTGGWDEQELAKELEAVKKDGGVSSDQALEDGGADPNPSPTGGGETDAEDPQYEDVPPQEALDKADTEGVVCRLVQVEHPTSQSRVHLPLLLEDGTYPDVAAPYCGARGSFGYLKADEALVIGPHGVAVCLRCIPMSENSCGCLCSHMSLGGGAEVYRCARRWRRRGLPGKAAAFLRGQPVQDHARREASLRRPGVGVGGFDCPPGCGCVLRRRRSCVAPA